MSGAPAVASLIFPVHLLAEPFGPALGALPGFRPRARRAPASHGLDECFDIIAAVMVRDLVAGLDVPDRPDLDHVLDEIDFGIRPARMIDVTRGIAAGCPIDGPACVDLEKVARIEIIGRLCRNLPASVANDELPFSDRHAREQPEPGPRSPDSQVA